MSIEINIKSLTGSNFILRVNPNDSISDIKQKLKKKIETEDIPEKYIYGYEQFRDNDKLSNYNINTSQSLMMTVILKDKTSMLLYFYILISKIYIIIILYVDI